MNNSRLKSGTRLLDVAEAAGVSMTTASVIVNGRADEYGISQDTRQRVETIIRQLNYTPSLAAREMAAATPMPKEPATPPQDVASAAVEPPSEPAR